MDEFEKKIGTTFDDYKGNEIYNLYHKYSHSKAVNSLLPISSGKTIIELGCAGGTYYNIIKSKGFDVIYGVDLSAERLEKAKQKGYITINSNAQDLKMDTGPVDDVLCIDMLVHVLKRNDRKLIFSRVNELLKNGGYFIFSIPSKKAYVYGDYGVDKKTIYESSDGIINDYCSLIGFDEIKDYITEFNFEIIKIIGTQFDLKLYKFLKRITKEKFHYSITLPLLDFFPGKFILKEFGKAAFFKIKKI